MDRRQPGQFAARGPYYSTTTTEITKNANSKQQTVRLFSNLMMEGRVRAALHLLADQDTAGPLPLDKLVDPVNNLHKTV